MERQVGRWRQILTEGDPLLPDGVNWVAERDGHVVGFCSAGRSRDEDTGPDVGELYAIYVEDRYWDTGTGAALMRTATAWFRDRFGAAVLWVLEGNTRARRFYERFGWTTDGAVKDDDRGSFVLREVRYRVEF